MYVYLGFIYIFIQSLHSAFFYVLICFVSVSLNRVIWGHRAIETRLVLLLMILSRISQWIDG